MVDHQQQCATIGGTGVEKPETSLSAGAQAKFHFYTFGYQEPGQG